MTFEERDHDIPVSTCFACGEAMDAGLATSKDGRKPRPGDLAVCIQCGHVMAFGPDLRVRELTEQERQEVVAANPKLRRIEQLRRKAVKGLKH